MIVLIFGLPGSGKTTLAREVSKYFNCPFVSTEEVRSFLYEEDNVPDDKDFSPEELVISYNTVFFLTKYIVENNLDIVIEGVFRNVGQRKKIYDLANENAQSVYAFCLKCDKDIIMERLINRKLEKTISPCGPSTINRIEQIFEVPQKGEECYLVDNNEMIDKAKNFIIKKILGA